MSLRFRAFAWSLALLAQFVFGTLPVLAQAASAPETNAAPDSGAIEEIIVTSRKREESIQDIPIAVSAFSADDLTTSNIDDVADIQMNVPNLQFSKTNFNGAGNISLRGVGNLATAATSETGTGIHINESPFAGARIFETEFFDVERIEVLRGPQGTIFGRSAPAGAVNIYTKKPVFEEWGGSVEGEYGDYNHGKIKGVFNVPLGEHFAARLGGYYFSRDGLTDNLNTSNDIDDRNLYMLRGSLAGKWDEVEFNLMASWFKEDDHRMRMNNQACTTDARPWPYSIGCVGGDTALERQQPNGAAGLGYSTGIIQDTMSKLAGTHNALIGFGLPGLPFFPNRLVTPTPRYLSGPVGIFVPYTTAAAGVPGAIAANGGYLMTDANADAFFGFGPDNYGAPTPYFGGGQNPSNLRNVNSPYDPRYAADEVMTTFVVNWDVTDSIQVTSVTGWHKAYSNSRTNYIWSTPTLNFPAPRHYDFTDSTKNSPWGDMSGNYAAEFGFDRSWGESTTFNQELRAASTFDGPLNFTTGVNFGTSEGTGDYSVWGTNLESMWDMPDVVLLCPNAAAYISANPGTSCHDVIPETSYFDNDTKSVKGSGWAIFGELYWDPFERTHVTLGARYSDDRKEQVARSNLWTCFNDPSTPAVCDKSPWEYKEAGFHNVTWKVGVAQDFDLPFAPDSLLYFNVSTGFKGGGFNPAVNTQNAPGTVVPPVFDEEKVTAYEGGYKGVLFDSLVFNFTGFYYDYKGMQVSKIVNRTAINENADVKIYGVEIETVYAVTDALRLDFNWSWLKTDIQKLSSVDPADPTAGTPGWTTIKQLLPFPGGQNAICNPAINNAALGVPVPPAVAPLCLELTPTNTLDASDGYLPDGFSQNLSGNELPSSPEFTLKAGIQYVFPFFGGWEATPRLDFSWRAEQWGRLYNTKRDKIPAWEQLDAQLMFTSAEGRWAFEIWAKNLQDNNDVTGHYFTDATSSNFTNLFILEPRTFGATIRYLFGDSEL
jgi:outer membrane receptor protein involved in Fe transport